ncbi:MAG TPA: proline--tRNA ligase [Candidatus Methanomethylophilaceae archaeon]|nr:proline--tRNA ligase [Candidatus Methanomethylophilaceae archaeon]
MKKNENFGEWYNEVVETAGLTDKRYPVKGMNVWTPYGWKIMTMIDSYTRRELDATGHDEVNFPLLIPETEFKKEKDHIKGFDSEVYWVTKAGDNELDVPLILRPTSETAMYPMFSLWVRSHQDLPLKIYQIVNTFRYETKQTRSFIRVREIHFFESHTCHTTEEDAQLQIEEDIEMLERIAHELCLPYFLLMRTDWDKFPGAHYTVGIDTVMPNGRSLQMGSIHHYRTNFSEPYDIKYEDLDGEQKYAHQTTFGMSERLLGAVVGVHGDDKGLILPPPIAPFQVVIIPIISKNNPEHVLDACKLVTDILTKDGIRVKLDDRNMRPGAKYYDWEMRGVPLRLEIGARDLENKVVSFARRDTGEKGTIDLSTVTSGSRLLLNDISATLYARAKEVQESAVVDITSMDEAPEDTDETTDDVILRFGWCGNEDCGHTFEETTGFKMLGTPYNGAAMECQCIACGRPSAKQAYAAHSM